VKKIFIDGKIIICCTIIFTTISCHYNNKNASPTDSLINGSGYFADTAYREGANLIAKNDCFTCHTINQQSIGPSFMQIAEKYHQTNGTAENLAQSVIKGSKGQWGDKVMVAHPTISFIEAKK